jgi:hypothetical protein
VALHALAQGCERALIFEDDERFPRSITPWRLAGIGSALESLPPDWMIFFLGHWPVWAHFVRRDVLRTSSGCAHAYIASRRLQEWLRDHPWTKHEVPKRPIVGRGLDSAYARLPGTYALFPMIAVQTARVNDNSTPQQKRRRRNKRRLGHIVTHSRYRELLLSRLMRLNELLVASLSPAFQLWQLGLRVTTGWSRPDLAGRRVARLG